MVCGERNSPVAILRLSHGSISLTEARGVIMLTSPNPPNGKILFPAISLSSKATSRNSFFRFGFKLSSILLARMCAPEVHHIGYPRV